MAKGKVNEQLIEQLISYFDGLEYGSVHIVVHDSQITQIERLEKHRFPIEKQVITKEQVTSNR